MVFPMPGFSVPDLLSCNAVCQPPILLSYTRSCHHQQLLHFKFTPPNFTLLPPLCPNQSFQSPNSKITQPYQNLPSYYPTMCSCSSPPWYLLFPPYLVLENPQLPWPLLQSTSLTKPQTCLCWLPTYICICAIEHDWRKKNSASLVMTIIPNEAFSALRESIALSHYSPRSLNNQLMISLPSPNLPILSHSQLMALFLIPKKI